MAGNILHFDGEKWSTVHTPAEFHFVQQIHGTSSENVYVVGAGGPSPDRNTIHHYDGKTWRTITSPYNAFWANAVFCDADDTYFSFDNKVVKFDGENWDVIGELPELSLITDIWKSHSTDLYVVGYVHPAQGPHERSIIYRHDGVNWHLVYEQDNLSHRFHLSAKLWGAGPLDVYSAIGSNVVHFDGNAWTPIDLSPGESFSGIHGTGPDSIFAIDLSGNVFNFNGDGWATSLLGKGCGRITDVWAISANDAHAGCTGDAMLHYDGDSWRELEVNKGALINAVWASGPDDVFAVGEMGVIYHYDGIDWTEMIGGVTHVNLKDVSGSGPDDVYAVGYIGNDPDGSDNTGLVLRYDGVKWSVLLDSVGASFARVWVAVPHQLFVMGEHFSSTDKKLIYFDGQSWFSVPGIDENFFNYASDLWGVSPEDLILSNDRTIKHLHCQ
jgi:hypothetical protein